MRKPTFAAMALAAIFCTSPIAAQDEPTGAPSPGEIVAAAPQSDWVKIAPEDLLVMRLAPAADGSERQVVIQLMPPPFSQGWVDNIRTLARDHWYDGIAVVRVQDNYVVQWGDPNGEDAEKAKPLPAGLKVMTQEQYVRATLAPRVSPEACHADGKPDMLLCDSYAPGAFFVAGFPFAGNGSSEWPVHCYGMVGVGRNYSPDTGTGAELYTVIGQAPRHLDRNIALVGRIVSGMENLSSLPRGTGPLGFYEDPAQRVPIEWVRLASELPPADQPHFEYLSTDSESFATYADARANRRDPFFIVPAGGADICNIPVPVRAMK